MAQVDNIQKEVLLDILWVKEYYFGIWERIMLISQWHKLLGKKILISPNRSQTYDLLLTFWTLYFWATRDLWELRP